ncbi:hypothetical protein [Herbaspirillum huttiense]|uniref:hypothetical protein n=1 Tax=Herbaspirillum huttiense TaxID=863372 RepID=UPI0031DB6B0F
MIIDIFISSGLPKLSESSKLLAFNATERQSSCLAKKPATPEVATCRCRKMSRQRWHGNQDPSQTTLYYATVTAADAAMHQQYLSNGSAGAALSIRHRFSRHQTDA